MDTVRFDFYRQEYALLMRAIIRAVDRWISRSPNAPGNFWQTPGTPP